MSRRASNPGLSHALLNDVRSRASRGSGAGGIVGYESGQAVPRPSYVSPYLRWGVISPRQAEAAGVLHRRRHGVLPRQRPELRELMDEAATSTRRKSNWHLPG